MAHALPAQILTTCEDGFLYCFFIWANSATQDLFTVFALLGFTMILFMATMWLGNTRAYGYASFVGLLGAVWFVTMGLMAWWIASAFILNGGVGLAVLILNEN